MDDHNTVSADNEVTKQFALLLVDDEKNVLSSLRRLFRKVKCNVFMANSGKEGLEILNENAIDVIISDARMPEMSGPELLTIVAEKYPNTSRILLTGYADMEAMVNAVNQGKISHYVEKPWDDERLISLVENEFSIINLKNENEALQSLVKKQNLKLKSMNTALEETVKERSGKIIKINETLQKNYRNTIDLLSGLLEQRQSNMHETVFDIVPLVQNMAKELEFNEQDLNHVVTAAKLRYIGKLCLSDEILSTPYTLLSKEQKHEFEQYPLTGSTLLTSIPPLRVSADIIFQHKEYLNGKGYPNGDWEKFISRPAQLLTVANDYLELINGKLLEDALPSQDALTYIDSRVSTFYAADIVEALKTALSDYENQDPIPEHRVWSNQLAPGMVLTRDLMSNNGVFLLSQGTTLEEATIAKLLRLEQRAKAELKFYVIIPEGMEIQEKSKSTK